MMFRPAHFEVAGRRLPWGTTLAEARRALAGLPGRAPYGGWPNLRLPGGAAYGVAASEVNLRAPAEHKPVLQVSWQLPPLPGQPPRGAPDPAHWLAALAPALGVPTHTEDLRGERGRGGSGMVVYVAHWAAEGVSLGLSIYGGVRRSPNEPLAAAGLYLDWTDLAAAARPFEAEARRQEARLAAAPFRPAKTYTLAEAQAAQPAGRPKRLLYADGLLDSPPTVAAALTPNQVALWPLGDGEPGGAWAVSTAGRSVLIEEGQPAAHLLDLQPARGPGAMQLHVGALALQDAAGQPTLGYLAKALAQLAGCPLTREKGLDD